MLSQVASITRQATRRPEDTLNILTGDCHPSYQSNQAMTGDSYFSLPHKTFTAWNTQYRPIPNNYQQLKDSYPLDVDFDIVLSHHKFSMFQLMEPLARKNNIPFISLEHTLPMTGWHPSYLKQWTDNRGDLNVFISDYSVEKWGYDRSDPTVRVIKHGINTDLFCPANVEKKNRILCVVNDWKVRNAECNFDGFLRTASDLPCLILGNTPGVSKPADSVESLISEYQSSRIFYNTSLISPVPMSVMEAMACGCAIVTTGTCMLPEIIQNGVNGFISNDEKELRGYLEMLLSDEKLATELGNNARKTILERYSLQQFVDSWNKIFRELL